MPATWQLAVSYLRAKLVDKTVFSLPTSVFNDLQRCPGEVETNYDDVNPWEAILELISAAPAEFDWNQTAGLTFFEVVNVEPGRRRNVALHHLDSWYYQVASSILGQGGHAS